jgi:hypothetical protein
MFSELTSDIMIFLIYIDQSEEENFKKSHTKSAKDMSEINIGDYLKYIDGKTKV